MNPENKSRSTYEPILQQKLDMMDEIISWWLKASDEERVTVMRAFIEHERLEATLADARVARADANVNAA